LSTRLELNRSRILAFRQRVGELGERLPYGVRSLRRAAWAGLQDSMPRAALLSIHARVEATTPQTWEHDALVQLWGPRFSAYVVATRDRAVFSLGRLPSGGAKREQAEELAARLRDEIGGEPTPYGEAGRALGVHPNQLRYAAPTGTLLLRWDGARQPAIWIVPPPDVDAADARLEPARRFLHVFGPSTADAFAKWAGVRARAASAVFDALTDELTAVRTPIGDAWILAGDEQTFLAEQEPTASTRLLPSGDAYSLVWGADRELLVPDPVRRNTLWTSRVWPGAMLVDGEIVGTWRRSQHQVTVQPWRRLSLAETAAVEAEAASLPLPDLDRDIVVEWDD
jgi:hypothetical protein